MQLPSDEKQQMRTSLRKEKKNLQYICAGVGTNRTHRTIETHFQSCCVVGAPTKSSRSILDLPAK